MLEEDLVIKEKLYKTIEDWEERLARNHIEGIEVSHIHKHLTNAVFDTTTP